MSIVTYGLSGGLPTYGLGGGAPSLSIYPSTGLISGGDVFTILGSGIYNSAFSDRFVGGSLDAVLWTDVSSGGGSVSTGTGLSMNTTAAGGTAGIRTIAAYKNFDVSVKFTYNDAIEDLHPEQDITFLRLTARIDASNNFTIAQVWDQTEGRKIKTTVTVGGVTSDIVINNVKAPGKTLRLVRYNGLIQAYVGSTLISEYRGWRTDDVNMEIASASGATSVALQTIVTSYDPAILTVFGDDISPFTYRIANRIIGRTPPTKLPSSAEIKIYGISLEETAADPFQYTAPLQLTISSGNSNIIIDDDDTLRDTSATLKGLKL